MVGFGFLFFTLVTAYGQIFDPHFTLWLVGAFPPYEWVAEGLSVIGTVGILTLIAIRQKHHPRREGRSSRFFGSNFWQAYFVELVILGVMVCILLLRSLEYALDAEHADALHYPFGQILGSAFDGLSAGTLENLIVLIAGIKIVISMTWAVTIGLNTTMGVAWHRFLAFPNIWFKRNPTPPGWVPRPPAWAHCSRSRSRARCSTSRTSMSSTRTRHSASARSRSSPGKGCWTSPPVPSAGGARASARPGTPTSRSRRRC